MPFTHTQAQIQQPRVYIGTDSTHMAHITTQGTHIERLITHTHTHTHTYKQALITHEHQPSTQVAHVAIQGTD